MWKIRNTQRWWERSKAFRHLHCVHFRGGMKPTQICNPWYYSVHQKHSTGTGLKAFSGCEGGPCSENDCCGCCDIATALIEYSPRQWMPHTHQHTNTHRNAFPLNIKPLSTKLFNRLQERREANRKGSRRAWVFITSKSMRIAYRLSSVRPPKPLTSLCCTRDK